MSEKQYAFKICLLGDPSVGKTSTVYRFVKNIFKENLASTIGVNISKKDIEIDEKVYNTHIWDLGGDKRFLIMKRTFLTGARGALLIFDKTRRKTFEKIDEWKTHFTSIMGDQPMILLGNKSDLTADIIISEAEAEEYAKDNDMIFISTSAKTGENIEEAFKELIKKIILKK